MQLKSCDTNVETVSKHEAKWSGNYNHCQVERDTVNHEQRQRCNCWPQQLVAPLEIENVVGKSQQSHAAD